MTQLPVTALVVSYHTGPRLHECLYALLSDPQVTAIIVVDNGNPAKETEWLRHLAAEREKVRLLEPGENLGFAAGNNLAAREAEEGGLLLINPDAVLKRGSVGQMLAAGQDLPRPWIVGGKLFGLDGHEARGARRRTLTLPRALAAGLGLNLWTLEATPPPAGPVRMDAVSGALMLTDMASYGQLGGFDEAYFLHVEDVDLCRRAWNAGGAVVYCPGAGALHYVSTSDAPSKTVAAHKADSLNLYFRKFASGPFERAMARLAAPLIRLTSQLQARKK